MKSLIVLVLLCVSCQSAPEDFNRQTELFYYRERIESATQVLQDKCPDKVIHRNRFFRRRRADIPHALSMIIELNHLKRVMKAVSECIVTTNDFNKTFTQPIQCRSSSTKNLTESWRKDRRGFNTVAHTDKTLLAAGIWFRFSGAAGQMLLDTCPPKGSCGSTGNGPYWSDDHMPTLPGQNLTITFFESHWAPGAATTECRKCPLSGTVTRCSNAPGDFVYRLATSMANPTDTMCGMDVHEQDNN